MHYLKSGLRIVVKIGSNLLVDHRGAFRTEWLDGLVADVIDSRGRGQEVLLVSSGAVAAGRRRMGLADQSLKVEQKQAAASIGQVYLTQAYAEAFARFGVGIAQVLLTLNDTESRRSHLNARATLSELLSQRYVPIINENDTVATSEIRFGDNDRLAARVSQMIGADTLVLLSDIDGLYSADPRTTTGALHIPEIHNISPEIEGMAGPPSRLGGSGGMVTKLLAARIALAAGCRMVVTRGDIQRPLSKVDEGNRATWFLPNLTPLNARKRWIAGMVSPAGCLLIDNGAALALQYGGSLLAAGIVAVEGMFQRGDPVVVRTQDCGNVAIGLVNYSLQDAGALVRRQSHEIELILGFRGPDEIIHRDNLALIN